MRADGKITDGLYNAEIKNAFLTRGAQEKKAIARRKKMFYLLAPHEEECGRDFCAMTARQCEAMVAMLETDKDLVYSIVARDLGAYTTWALKNEVPGASKTFSEYVKDRQTDEMKNSMFRGPDDLLGTLDAIFDTPKEKTVDIVYRSYMWLAFSGVKEKEAELVKSSDIDIMNEEIHLGEDVYPMYKQSIPDLYAASTLTEFRFVNPGYRHIGGEIIKPRVDDSDSILRRTKSSAKSRTLSLASGVRGRMSFWWRENENNTRRLGYNSVYLSGLFYRMYEVELAGGVADFRSYVDTIVGPPKSDSKEDVRRAVASRSNHMVKYRKMYDQWKQAFGLT